MVHRHRQKTDEPKKNRGARKKIPAIVRQTTCREASKTGNHAIHIHRDLSLNVSVRTVQRTLAVDKNLKFSKMKSSPALEQRRKGSRIAFAKKSLKFGSDFWRKVAFSDEKRFCLDEPDGHAYYWHDIRKEPRYLTRRQAYEGKLLVLFCINANVPKPLAQVIPRISGKVYIQTLETGLHPAIPLLELDDIVF